MSTRQPAVAGMFYPKDPEVLRNQVQTLVGHAAEKAQLLDPPKAMIVPHAGYIYSGPIAALGYALMAKRADEITRVVVLGPTHRVAVQGMALPGVDAFATPLGVVPLDHDAVQAVSHLDRVVVRPDVHADEHSLEVHLPFLQETLGEFSLVPLAVGQVNPQTVSTVIDALWGGPETVVVVSSDLSHYLPYAQAQKADIKTIDQILALEGIISPRQACGASPVNGLLEFARSHSLHPYLIGACNSGDTAGDHCRVVGYATIGFEEAA